MERLDDGQSASSAIIANRDEQLEPMSPMG
jgi:hypothetical protein